MVDNHEAAEIRQEMVGEMEEPVDEPTPGTGRTIRHRMVDPGFFLNPEIRVTDQEFRMTDLRGTRDAPQPRETVAAVGRRFPDVAERIFGDTATATTRTVRVEDLWGENTGTTPEAEEVVGERVGTERDYHDGYSREDVISLKVPVSGVNKLDYLIADSRRLDFLEKYALMCLTRNIDADMDKANDLFNEVLSFVDSGEDT